MTKPYALALAVSALACGGEKKAAPESSASVPPAVEGAPVTPSTPAAAVTKCAADSAASVTKRAADSTAVVPSCAADSAAAARKSESPPPLRDSAFGPTAEVDEQGNVKPIKRP